MATSFARKMRKLEAWKSDKEYLSRLENLAETAKEMIEARCVGKESGMNSTCSRNACGIAHLCHAVKLLKEA